MKIRVKRVNLLKVPRIIRYTTRRRCVRLILTIQTNNIIYCANYVLGLENFIIIIAKTQRTNSILLLPCRIVRFALYYFSLRIEITAKSSNFFVYLLKNKKKPLFRR